MTNNIKNYMRLILPIAIAVYMMYPMLIGNYGCFDGEYEMRMSFKMNFIDALKQGKLSVWNEYVGSGHPAMYFGHYPITQDTLFYILSGVNNFTYNFVRFLNLVILLATFVYAGKILNFGYLISLAGALIYFSVNFVSKWIVVDTIGNLVLVYPLLIALLFQIIKCKQWKTILIFNLVYIFWLTGGHILYVYMHLIMLSIIYWIAVFTITPSPFKLSSFKKYIALYFILFVIPMLAVLYQYYFIYDVIRTSNRFKEGLIVSPFKPIVWVQLWRSFQSSSYFWVGLLLIPLSFVRKSIRVPKIVPILLIGTLSHLIITKMSFTSSSNIVVDYLTILNSADFRIALLIFLVLACFPLSKNYYSVMKVNVGDIIVFAVYASLLSYYFYSPENIFSMDYNLFKELSIYSRVIFILCLLFSARSYRNNKIVQILVISLVVLYLIRSHLTIPLMRFAGIVWYPVCDGSIFSALFAFLFLFGLWNILKNILSSPLISKSKMPHGRRMPIVKSISYSILLVFIILATQDSFNKFYKGHTNQLVFPKHIELTAIPILDSQLLELDKTAKYFYRIFTSKNYIYLPGRLQNHKIYEASIYDSSISKDYKDFFEYTILKCPQINNGNIKNVLPCNLFTRHIHAGIGVPYYEIPYREVYLIDDRQYLNKENLEFFWDLAQVKYLILANEFSNFLTENSDGGRYYKLLGAYPNLGLNLYEITKDKRYSRLAVLPLDDGEDFGEVIEKINSDNVDILRQLYLKVVYLDQDAKDFSLLKDQRGMDRRYYEIDARRRAILIEFESWNHNWKLSVNDEDKKLQKIFRIFKGIRLEPGFNKVKLSYNLNYFKELFLVSVFVILVYLGLLIMLNIKNVPTI